MDLKEAVTIAKRQVSEQFAEQAPQNLRLEEYLYDDHLGVWSLTIGFSACATGDAASSVPRSLKLVRVSQTDKSVLSVRDR
jgi:hypothetical protein